MKMTVTDFGRKSIRTAIFSPNPEVREQVVTRQEPSTAQVPDKYRTSQMRRHEMNSDSLLKFG